MSNEIACPKCGSTQITADKKGFSGKKAVVGGLLTGGIGLLAGTIGSNDVIITCLACGNQFKPGQGNTKYDLSDCNNINEEALKIAQNNFLDAVKYYKDKTGVSLKIAMSHVSSLKESNGATVDLPPQKSGIAKLASVLILLALLVWIIIGIATCNR